MRGMMPDNLRFMVSGFVNNMVGFMVSGLMDNMVRFMIGGLVNNMMRFMIGRFVIGGLIVILRRRRWWRWTILRFMMFMMNSWKLANHNFRIRMIWSWSGRCMWMQMDFRCRSWNTI